MNTFLRIFRFIFALTVAYFIGATFLGHSTIVSIPDIQFTPFLQRLFIDFTVGTVCLFVGIILLTLVFGRFYCSTICPLGLCQEVLMRLFQLFRHKKSIYRPNTPYKYFWAALAFGLLAGGTIILLKYTDPYAIFASAATGLPYGILLALLITLLVFFKDRFFCTHICPVGAILGLFSKHAIFNVRLNQKDCISCGLCAKKCPTKCIDFKNKKINNENCINCFACLHGCPKNALHFTTKHTTSSPIPFDPVRRRFLMTGATIILFGAALKTGGIWIKNTAHKIKEIILPPGAVSPETFANRCINCNLCEQNCPMKIIKKANSAHPTVHIQYNGGICDFNCHKCGSICPTGAIKQLTLSDKQKTQIGVAVVDKSICVKCGLCVHVCPRHIIEKEAEQAPVIRPDKCIGCGACQNVCPVQAIHIKAVNHQRLLS